MYKNYNLSINITSVKLGETMDLRKKIGIALRVTFLLGIWAMICLLSEENLSYVKKTMRAGIEWVSPHGNYPILVKK